MGWRAGTAVVTFAALALGCGSSGRESADASLADARIPCSTWMDCDFAPFTYVCEHGYCVDVCDGIPGGRDCMHGEPNHLPACCPEDHQCCQEDQYRVGCFPADVECPFLCPRSLGSYCPAGSHCLIEYDADDVPPDGTCEEDLSYISCLSECVPSALCGDHECCGANTRCEDGCCVADESGGATGRFTVLDTEIAGAPERGRGISVSLRCPGPHRWPRRR